MKKTILISIFFTCQISVFSQNLDLIVTTVGDSIACKIDSVTTSHIYLQMKTNGNGVSTSIDKSSILDYQMNKIENRPYMFKPGTTIIQPINVSLNKAFGLKKNGKTVTAIGGAGMGAGVIILLLSEGLGGVAAGGGVFIVGLGTMGVGITMNITGKKRIERINVIRNTAYNGISIEIEPCTHYNFINQDYQPGIKFRIRF